ncbi:outer membrane protein assembly factor BamB family protein [Nocardiopsis suaedae]|uniref:PQQ-binding-like beta-propeller repeat protein n=1 Tax=Nocardiopsis suaedae TaxID=3018444 RepID=A0ABT4TG40_9ACTN|nr:PQQ-binding-like beta-propeller repeat protein [Nocardiopsis suaedae]MDA2803551.1 PQQ-binding-like beta-propeller repeat protein [Nocardiopsis suaedae]
MQTGEPSPRPSRRFAPLLAAVAVLAAPACTGTAADGPRETAEQQGAEDRVFDPPTEFDTGQGVEIDLGADSRAEGRALRPAMDGGTVYYGDEDGLHAVDAEGGRDLWSVPTRQPVVDTRADSAVLAEIDGRAVVVGAFETRNPGRGSAVRQERLEVLVADARNGELLWQAEHIPGGPPPDPEDVFAVGADDDAVVVSYGTAVAFSPGDGELLWTDSGMRPEALADGTVVGWSVPRATGDEEGAETAAGPTGVLTAAGAADGARRWSQWEAESGQGGVWAHPLRISAMDGSRLLVGRETPPEAGAEPAPEWAVVDAGAGEVVYWTERLSDQVCRYDEQSMLVCWNGGRTSPEVDVYTAEGGDRLWNDPGFGGGVPTGIRGVWHGVVYTDKGLNGGSPGIYSLDFQNDLELDPGTAPDLTDGVVGLRFAEDGTATAYPAVA